MESKATLHRALRYSFLFATISFPLSCASPLAPKLDNRDYQKLVVGQWRGVHHDRVFYADGSCFVDPEPEERPVGQWRINGKQLMIRLPGKASETTEEIVKLTPIELVVITGDKTVSYKRARGYLLH